MTTAGEKLKETKARGWEIDPRGKVKIIEAFGGDPPDEYYLLHSDRTGVQKIQEIKLKPEMALVGEVQYQGKRATRTIWKDKRGKVVSTFVYSYDERGLMAKREEVGKADRVFSTTICSCDAKGNLVEERYLKGEEVLGRNVYTHDAAGRVATEAHHDAQDVCNGSYHFTYEGNGRLASRAWHKADGEEMTVFKYSYDSSGNRTKAEMWSQGKLETTQEFDFDERGNMLEERWIDSDGNHFRTIKHKES